MKRISLFSSALMLLLGLVCNQSYAQKDEQKDNSSSSATKKENSKPAQREKGAVDPCLEA